MDHTAPISLSANRESQSGVIRTYDPSIGRRASPSLRDARIKETHIIDNLIREIENSSPQNPEMNHVSAGYRAQASMEVEPLNYAKRSPAQSPTEYSAPRRVDINGVSPGSVNGDGWKSQHPPSFSIKTFKFPDNTTPPTPTVLNWTQLGTYLDQTPSRPQVKEQKSSSKEHQSSSSECSPVWPDLTSARLDPRTQNAVKRYRRQSAPEDPDMSITSTIGAFSKSQTASQHKRQISHPIRLSPTVSSTDYVSRIESSQNQVSSPKGPKLWFNAMSRKPKSPTHSIFKHKSSQGAGTTKSFFGRHLKLHPTPSFTANYQKDGQSSPPRPFTSNNIEPLTLDLEPSASEGVFTYQTMNGNQIFIPQKSLGSIKRSATRRSMAGYQGKHRINIKGSARSRQPRPLTFQESFQDPTSSPEITSPKQTNSVTALWFENADAVCSTSPSDPSSPLSSEENTSTAPSSPVTSSEGRPSSELEGSKPQRKNSHGMSSSITSWEELNECGPQFVHQMSVRESRQKSPVKSSTISEYSAKTLPLEYQKSAPEVVIAEVKADGASEHSINKIVMDSESSKHQVQQSEQPKERKPKPHVSNLIIPSTHSNTILQIYANKALPRLPDVKPGVQRVMSSQGDIIQSPTPRSQSTINENSNPISTGTSPDTEKTLTSALTHSILSPPPTRTPPSPPKTPPPRSIARPATKAPLPARLTHPLTTWIAPQLLVSCPSLTLDISRQEMPMSFQRWFIEDPVSHIPALKCIGQTSSLCRKREFWTPDGGLMFSFHRAVGSTFVAEDSLGSPLFVVRKTSLMSLANWTITFKEGEEGESKQWIVRGDSGGRGLEVMWGGWRVGGIEVGRGKHSYTVIVNEGMNFAIMAALTTVFDDFRVDEGLC